MRIDYLADHQHLIPELARLHFAQWSYLRPGESLQGRSERLRSCCGKGLPTVIVGLLDDALCGSAMLVPHDMQAHLERTPWLAGVYVKPELRGKGYASILIERIVQQARALQYPEIYLYTPTHELLYAHLGWSTLERCSYQGSDVVVMCRRLA